VLSDVRVPWGSKRVRGVESFLHELRDTLLGLAPKVGLTLLHTSMD
jgi:hypothetical protein